MIARIVRATPRVINNRRAFQVSVGTRSLLYNQKNTPTLDPSQESIFLTSKDAGRVEDLAARGQMDEARKVFDMTDESKKTDEQYRALIQGYAEIGNLAEAQQLFFYLQENRKEIGAAVYRAMIAGYSRAGMTDNASQLFKKMTDAGFKANTTTSNNFLEGLCLTGRLAEAQTFFDSMTKKNDMTLNILINGYLKAGDVDTAKKIFDEMPVKYDMKPDSILTKKMEAALKNPYRLK